ncbi:MAG: prepilin peptidase [Candidatus Lokiarchaeota archaeon]|nr:prepilin peptidase [Candidatus Lokiarchaeota archaeon]
MILSINLFFFYTNIVLIYCMYRDIKFRKIPNKAIIGFLLIGSLLAFTEDLDIYNDILIFIITKVFFLFFAFIFSFVLFCLKIIGGSDGKLLIMLTFSYPIYRFNFQWLFSFFFVFLFLYLILVVVNYLFNNFLSNNNSYDMIYSLEENVSFLHKVFIITFYKFLDFSQINRYTNEKFVLKSLNLFYNKNKGKFQILTQYRPPLVILIFFANNYIILKIFC